MSLGNSVFFLSLLIGTISWLSALTSRKRNWTICKSSKFWYSRQKNTQKTFITEVTTDVFTDSENYFLLCSNKVYYENKKYILLTITFKNLDKKSHFEI